MPKLNILNKNERADFDNPPKFNADLRAKYFDMPDHINERLKKFSSATNKIGLILQWGYFKSCGKFFTPAQFYKKDINYIARILNLSVDDINFENYASSTLQNHKATIVNDLKFKLFQEREKSMLQQKVNELIAEQVKPRQILINAIEFLKGTSIEIPRYNTFATMITDGFNQFEEELLTTIENVMLAEDASLLDNLLPDTEEDKKYQRSKLASYKRINHSIKKGQIKKSLDIFKDVKFLAMTFESVMKNLELSFEAIKYYAVWVYKARTEQLNQFERSAKRYLHLLAFIAYQFYLRQDVFTDTFEKCVQSSINFSKKSRDTDVVASSESNANTIIVLAQSNQTKDSVLDNIRHCAFNVSKADKEKVLKIQNIIDEFDNQNKNRTSIDYDTIKNNANKVVSSEDYLDNLEKDSLRLQGRVNGIVQQLVFNDAISDKYLMAAINYFKLKEGNVDKNAPTEFLDAKLKKAIFLDDERFRVSLYKSLLFTHMLDAIRAGKLTLKYSFRYLSVDEYLINKQDWQANQVRYLKETKLGKFADIDKLLKKLKKKLAKAYAELNGDYKSGKNAYLKLGKEERMKLTTPKVDKFNDKKVSELLFNDKYIPIIQVLKDVHQTCGFLDGFEHYAVKNVKGKVTPALLLAGIIGKGCNIGLNKIALTSKGVNVNELNHMANWYFSLENINTANNRIIQFINKLALPQLFLRDKLMLHTSGDGQRKPITVESLNSNWSFKYFGNSKGVSIYRFIDERHILFYSTVISSSEREAGFALDGLLYNNEIKSDIHSSDTHGFSEVIFGLMHLFDITFAPRLANFKDLQLYGFGAKKSYLDEDYTIIPDKAIRKNLIKTYWDDILRTMVSLKFKKVTASLLLKRLSSYTKDNPLYDALREFGRIIKSHFILTYANDLPLRQSIQKQLNKIELANKFSNAIFFDNNREFKIADKEEQELVVGCIQLMQNGVILWNYMYLSQRMLKCKNEEEKAELIKTIKNGSILIWRHINMYGEYDFTSLLSAVNDDTFNVKDILELEVAA